MKGPWQALKDWLRFSTHVHLRQEETSTLGDVVDLIDRFIDGTVRYDLEWDDFISWENRNPGVEAIRLEIAPLELLFFSEKPEDRKVAFDRLLNVRNRSAALIGRPARVEES